MILLNNKKISKIHFNKDIAEAYLGSKKIFPSTLNGSLLILINAGILNVMAKKVGEAFKAYLTNATISDVVGTKYTTYAVAKDGYTLDDEYINTKTFLLSNSRLIYSPTATKVVVSDVEYTVNVIFPKDGLNSVTISSSSGTTTFTKSGSRKYKSGTSISVNLSLKSGWESLDGQLSKKYIIGKDLTIWPSIVRTTGYDLATLRWFMSEGISSITIHIGAEGTGEELDIITRSSGEYTFGCPTNCVLSAKAKAGYTTNDTNLVYYATKDYDFKPKATKV